MSAKWKIIFWGLFLCTFNLTLQGIPIPPVFVSLMLVHYGMQGLLGVSENQQLRKGLLFCKLGIILDFAGFVMGLFGMTVIAGPLGIALNAIAGLGIAYFLLAGAATGFAAAAQGTDMAHQAEYWNEKAMVYLNKIKLFVVWRTLAGMFALVGAISMMTSALMGALVVGFCVNIWLLVLVHKIEVDWRESSGPAAIGEPIE